MGEQERDYGRDLKHLKILLAIIVTAIAVAAMKTLYFVAMPLVLSMFLVVLVRPIQARLKAKLPEKLKVLSVAAAMLVFVFALAAGVGVLLLTFVLIRDSVAKYQDQIQMAGESVSAWVSASGLDLSQMSGVTDLATEVVGTFVTSTWAAVGMLVFLFFLVLLELLELSQWRKTLSGLSGQDDISPLFDTVASKTRRYLLIQTMIGAISGVAEGLWLWSMGVELALLWALLFFILNYIPAVGAIVAAIPPIVLAFALHGLGWGIAIAAGILVIEQTLGNFIDPRMQGKALRISPLVVLVSVVFWGWLWGVAGAVLAVPLTVTAVVALAHWPSTRGLAMLLSSTPDASELPGQRAR